MKLTSIKILLVFSSVGHLGWILFPLLKYPIIVLLYLLIYSLIVLPIISLLFFSNYQQLFNQIDYKIVIPLFTLILSLSGIPPLIGFFLKWTSLTFISRSIIIILLFSLMACISFYIYIRICYKRFLVSPFSFKQDTVITRNTKWIWTLNMVLPILPILW